jgi:CRP/FNR family cyclic AMP-dependent transcriptional regulator
MASGGGAVTDPDQETRRALLKRHVLLGRLEDSDLVALLARAPVERYGADQPIFRKGAPGQSMLAVLRGSVKISSLSPDGKEIVLNVIHAGEFFGEISLLDGRERTADATALGDCEMLVFYRRDFLPLLARRADFCVLLLEVLCQRLRQTSEQVEDVVFGDLASRIAKTLLRLAQHPERGAELPAPLLRITQQELGNMVGSARESINRHLQVWQAAGLIKLGKGSIFIRDIPGLERMV